MRTTFLIILVILPVLLACGQDSPGPLTTEQGFPENQQVLCEVVTTNFAWGRVFQGKVIDVDGNIWSYSFDDSDSLWHASDPDSISLEELVEKYNHNLKRIGEVEPGTIAEIIGLLPGADIGPLSEPQYHCNDFGTIEFLAYTMDENSELYHPILVRVVGDVARKNLSGDAEALYHIMARAIGWDSRNGPCDYTE